MVRSLRLVTDTPQASTETTRELQARVGRFARAIFILSVVMFAVSLLIEAVLSRDILRQHLTAPGRLVHFVAAAFAVGTWLLCRGRTLAPGILAILDAALTISLCTCWALLGTGIASDEAIEFSIILATTYTIIARSVVVPSSFGRTLAISAISVVPTVVFFFSRGMSFMPHATTTQVRTFLVFSTLWCVVGVLTAALNSRQLYGLRAQIREIGKLGQYTLEAKLGEGGMGVVYRASHAMLRRPAAIKLLLPDRAGERDLARFEREVQLTSRLAHPNTVSIFDYGRTDDGVFYYVMEHLNGLDLDQLVKEAGPLDAPRAIHILAQACGALAEAHALGLIHRDIKPANIMLTTRVDEPDIVKVVDFGLVKTLDPTAAPALSGANDITGTPMYLAPEAITSADAVDARSDIYAMGAVGYFLLTGEHAFSGGSIIEVFSKHIHEAPVPPSERLGAPVPSDLEALVLACLAKKPEARPATAGALRDALLACTDADRYDAAASRAWWKNHEARAGAAKPDTNSTTRTIPVDLLRREIESA